jgi:cytidylate kinase
VDGTADGVPVASSGTPTPEQLTRVVALDGPAGSGKSTVARSVAEALGWRFVDTGAGYRAATLAALRAGIDLADTEAVHAVVARSQIRLGTSSEQPTVTLDGEDVSTEIRSPEVTAAVSAVSGIKTVRALLIELQREAMGTDGAVVEGRDIATVVAPNAGVKVYLDARPEVRAARRSAEELASQTPPSELAVDGGSGTDLDPGGPAASNATPFVTDAAVEALTSRDERDNQTTPLEVSDGAVHLDTSDLSLTEVVAAVVDLARAAGLADATSASQTSNGADAPPHPGTGPRKSQRWVRATGTRKAWLVAASRPFGQVLFRSLFRVSVVGAEHVPSSGAVLIAGNHTGFLDGPLAYAFSPRPATFIAKSELFIGPLARALGWLGQIPVHRGRPDRSALRLGLSVLRTGGALGVFPEGTRGAGQLATVSDGVAYLALRSGAPVVPLAVIGTSEAMPKGAKLPRWRAPVGLVFGPAFIVEVEGDPRARRTVRAAGEQIRLQLLAHLQASQGVVKSTSGSVHDTYPGERSA